MQYNDSLCSLAHILHTKEGVIQIRRAQDAGGKHDGERAWRHFIVLFFLSNPKRHTGQDFTRLLLTKVATKNKLHKEKKNPT